MTTLVLLILIAATRSLVVAEGEAMETQTETIVAEIGLFSGRPNPRMQLDDAAGEELIQLTSRSVGIRPTHPPPPARLGSYYGFVIRIPTDKARSAKVPAEFAVYEGVITEGRGRDQKHWRDTANLEEYLVREAYKQGYAELLRKAGVQR